MMKELYLLFAALDYLKRVMNEDLELGDARSPGHRAFREQIERCVEAIDEAMGVRSATEVDK